MALRYEEQRSTSPELEQLFGDTFGARTDQHELNARITADPNKRTLAALDGERMVGVSVVGITDGSASSRSYEPFGQVALERLRDHSIGCFHAMAIDSAYKRRGIATDLATQQLEWLRERGATLLVGVSWEHGDLDHSGHLFRLGGFDELARCHRFYRAFHAEGQQRCPRCDTELCECTAILFARPL